MHSTFKIIIFKNTHVKHIAIGQLSIIALFEVYVSKIALEGESHKNDIH